MLLDPVFCSTPLKFRHPPEMGPGWLPQEMSLPLPLTCTAYQIMRDSSMNRKKKSGSCRDRSECPRERIESAMMSEKVARQREMLFIGTLLERVP